MKTQSPPNKPMCSREGGSPASSSTLDPRLRGDAIAARGDGGFTLVELMVALVIFSMLSAAGVALLSFSVRAQAAANERLDEAATLRRLNALLTADLAQAVPRPYRDRAGARQPAFTGSNGTGTVALGLVRGGWSNPDLTPRASLQRVEYRLAADRLERRAWPHVDGADPLPAATLLSGVRSLRIRYRVKGAWTDRWNAPQAEALPQAVEVIAEVANLGAFRQLFLVGVGTDRRRPETGAALPSAAPPVIGVPVT